MNLRSKLCLSIGNADYRFCSRVLKGVPFAEIRLDLCSLSLKDVEHLFSKRNKLIATCRPGKLSIKKRKQLLIHALEAGASYVDIELDSSSLFLKEIQKTAARMNARIIVSYHNHKGNLSARQLKKAKEKCFSKGAELAKISCTVKSKKDSMLLLDLLNDERPMIVTGMGNKGAALRVVAPLFGSCVAYVTSEHARATAAGQLTRNQMLQAWKVLGVL